MTGIRSCVAAVVVLAGTAGAADAQVYYFNPTATLYGQYPYTYAAPLVYPYANLSAPGAFYPYGGNFNYGYSYNYNYNYTLPSFGYGFNSPLYNANNASYFFNRAARYGSFGNPYGYRFR
jgi:hypothetical protein